MGQYYQWSVHRYKKEVTLVESEGSSVTVGPVEDRKFYYQLMYDGTVNPQNSMGTLQYTGIVFPETHEFNSSGSDSINLRDNTGTTGGYCGVGINEINNQFYLSSANSNTGYNTISIDTNNNLRIAGRNVALYSVSVTKGDFIETIHSTEDLYPQVGVQNYYQDAGSGPYSGYIDDKTIINHEEPVLDVN